MNEELKTNYAQYILDIDSMRKKYEKDMRLRKYKHEKMKNEIKNKYKLINEKLNFIYRNKVEKLDILYTKIIQKYSYNKKIENMNNIKRLNEIVYNTYEIFKNNYFN